MVDQPTLLTVVVDGMRYSNFTRAAVSYAANQAARAFALTVTDSTKPWAEQWGFMPGSEVTIFANSELIVTGYVDRMTPTFDATHHTVEISGRSKSADFLHSAVEHDTGEFRDKTILDIAKELDKQGVGVTSDIEQPKLEYFRLNPMETVYAAMDRMTRRHPMLMQGMADGSVKLTEGGTGGDNAPLIEGVNILGGSATFDQSDGHDEYKVRGQRVYGVDKKSLRIEARSTNPRMKRHRPKHIHQETDIDDQTAQKRADYHRDRQVGESVTANIKVQSWFDGGGALWKANGLVYVYSPTLKLDNQMLIKSVQLTQDNSGSFANLSLCLPQAFGGKGTATGKGGTGSQTQSPWAGY